MAATSNSQINKPWKVLEFYSGIGGMRYSLMRAGVNAEIVQAFEINDKANDVYEHNFGHRPFQGNIQSLTASDLDSFGAHAWLLSPPCQPYTRQGLQKHSGDARAFSFLQILELIQLITQPPSMIFVENVVGFEISDTHSKMIEIFVKTHYVMQEFILSPLQFGVPYSRPRYFCLAKQKPFPFPDEQFNNQLIWFPGPLSKVGRDVIFNEHVQPEESGDKLLYSCKPIQSFLELFNTDDEMDTGSVSGHERDGSLLDEYLVPLSLVERWGNAMDVVYPDSKRCCCFTKSYYRYVKGTGSLLATVQPEKNGKESSLGEQRLRYFTPREVWISW